MIAMRPLALLLVFSIPLTPGLAQKTAAEWLKQAEERNKAGDRTASYRALEEAVNLAVQERDSKLEASARFRLGTALTHDAPDLPRTGARFGRASLRQIHVRQVAVIN